MDFEDIGNQYKEIKIWKRLLVLTVLALAPGSYDIWDRWKPLEAERDSAIAERAIQKAKFDEALQKHKELTKVEAELARFEAQVKVARLKMPDEIFMDQILQKTELIAQDLGISLKLFSPKDEIPSESAFKFLKLPIALELVGTYAQIASFFDHIVHLELIIHIENMSLALDESSDSKLEKSSEKGEQIDEEIERSKVRLRVSCDMVIYRSYTPREEEALQSIYDNKRKAEMSKAKAASAQQEGDKENPAPGSQPSPASEVPKQASLNDINHKSASL